MKNIFLLTFISFFSTFAIYGMKQGNNDDKKKDNAQIQHPKKLTFHVSDVSSAKIRAMLLKKAADERAQNKQ